MIVKGVAHSDEPTENYHLNLQLQHKSTLCNMPFFITYFIFYSDRLQLIHFVQAIHI